jgi:hypothetical protein
MAAPLYAGVVHRALTRRESSDEDGVQNPPDSWAILIAELDRSKK